MNKSKTDITWERALSKSMGHDEIDWERVAELMKEHSQSLEDDNNKLISVILNKIEESMAKSPEIKSLIQNYLVIDDEKPHRFSVGMNRRSFEFLGATESD